MAEEKEMFELETISDKTTNVLCVKDFEKQLALAQKILEDHPVFEILTDDDKKEAKAIRASLNKVVKAVDRRRIDDIADYTNAFSEQCKQISALFDARQKEFGEKINAYEDAHKAVVGVAAPTKITATLKYTDPKITKLLTDFATKHGCELVIK